MKHNGEHRKYVIEVTTKEGTTERRVMYIKPCVGDLLDDDAQVEKVLTP